MFGKGSSWWFGENSLFASAISVTKYGKSNGNGLAEADVIKYGIMGLFAYMVIKK